jgi:hypothetical protein
VQVPLKGIYPEKAVEFTTSKSVDSVWSVLNAIFTSNGLPVESIDRKQGKIVTKKASMNPVFTFEKTDGNLERPEAWVALMKVFNKEKEWKPKRIYGKWNIQVAEKEKGITTIKIDPIVMCTYYPNSFTIIESRGQSTGKLEQLLESTLNKN